MGIYFCLFACIVIEFRHSSHRAIGVSRPTAVPSLFKVQSENTCFTGYVMKYQAAKEHFQQNSVAEKRTILHVVCLGSLLLDLRVV